MVKSDTPLPPTRRSWHDHVPPPLAALGASWNDRTPLSLSPAGAATLPPPPPPPPPPPNRRLRYAGTTALVFFSYAFAMFINGSSRRISRSQPRVDLRSLPLVLGLLLQETEPMYSLASYRVLAVGVLLVVMRWRGDVPREPQPLTRKWLVPYMIGVCNASGYLAFNVLCSLNGIALWSSLIGCYVLLPVSYGILVRGESRPPRKLAGIAACLAAVVMLSLGQATGGDADTKELAAAGGADASGWEGGVLKAGLFSASVLLWSVCDAAASYVARPPGALHMYNIAGATMMGFASVAWACAGLGYLLSALATPLPVLVYPDGGGGGGVPAPLEPAATRVDAGAWVGGQAVLLVGQVLGVAGWWGTVRLGTMGEASSFLPAVSTYTVLAAVLGLAINGETMSPLGYMGMATAAGGVILVASAQTGASGAPGGGGDGAGAAHPVAGGGGDAEEGGGVVASAGGARSIATSASCGLGEGGEDGSGGGAASLDAQLGGASVSAGKGVSAGGAGK